MTLLGSQRQLIVHLHMERVQLMNINYHGELDVHLDTEYLIFDEVKLVCLIQYLSQKIRNSSF